MRCVALLSGGLDACLAVRIMQLQGVEVFALALATPFVDVGAAQAAAAALDVPLTVAPLTPSYAQRLAAPRLGRVGPAACCLDCRVAMLRAAKAHMEATDSAFVVTGEVLGQRPRTGRFDLELVAIHGGLERLVVRPLSARRLPETLPEECGWLNRQQLGGIEGKGRKEQQQLARQLKVALVAPRSDCPLLGETLAQSVAWALRLGLPLEDWLLAALRRARFHALTAGGLLLTGRNQQENALLQSAFAECRDRTEAGKTAGKSISLRVWLLEPVGAAGPSGLVVAGSRGDAAALLSEALAVLRAKLRGADRDGRWRLSGMRGQWEGRWSPEEGGEAEVLREVLACGTPFGECGSSSPGG